MTWLKITPKGVPWPDLAPKAVNGQPGETGPQGLQGAQGPQGIQGRPGGIHASAPGLGAGSYVSSVTNATALSTIAGAAGRLDFYPFIPARDLSINELSVEVTTLIALSQARLGIYSSNANGLPDALLTGQGSLLDCSVIGEKKSVVAVLLTAGSVYWIAIHSSLAQTYRGIPVASMMPIGHTATGATVLTLRRATLLFSNGLPATAPTTTPTSSIAPLVKLRLGS